MSLDKIHSQLQPTTKRYTWIELLRVLAVFGVILIHESFPILAKNELPYSYWLAANFYDSIARSSVPTFFMISGYLLLGQKETTFYFFRRRFIKVGIPTLVWTVIYLLWRQPAYYSGEMSIPAVALSMLKAIYTRNPEIHLWFLYVLIGLYIVLPILRVFVTSASQRALIYFLAIWLLTDPFLGLTDKVFSLVVNENIRLPLVTGYVGYLVLGYVLGRWRLSRRSHFVVVSALLCLSFFTIFWGTVLLSGNTPDGDYFFYDYLGFPVILMASCIFLLFRSLEDRLSSWYIPIKYLAATAFGIYLIHILVGEVLRKGLLGFRLYSWIGDAIYMIPLTSLAIFFLSFVIVFVIQRLPWLKYIFL